MYVLALDTATNSGGVAVSRNQEVIGQVFLKTPLRYSETIIPMIDFLLSQLELGLEQIGLLSVAAGPGSFTGLRVGLSTAKALGQAKSIQAIAISTLEALAFRYRAHDRFLAPLLDARRQQVYAALYRADSKGVALVKQAEVMRPDRWISTLDVTQEYVFVGDGARQYRSAIEASLPAARVFETDNQILESLCLLGYRKLALGEVVAVDELEAIYVRPPDVRG